jgi:uncharacterized protein DUF4386
MSTTLTMQRIAITSPRFKARIAGALYLLSVLAAAFAEMLVHGGLNVAGSLIAVFGMIAVTLLFYGTLSPMNRSLCLLAASFNLVGLIFELLRVQPQGVNIAIVFDGFYCILIGYIVLKSASGPRILGALMALGGLGWLTFLSPGLANYLSSYNLGLGLLGEGSVFLWLLAAGVKVQPWKEQTKPAGVPVRM